MPGARTWARALLAGGVAVAVLAGCSSGGDPTANRLFSIARGQLFGDDEAEPAEAREPTRTELSALGAATIGFGYGEVSPVYMVALADNGGYLTYQDKGRRGVVLLGGAVAGTLGLGNDLVTVKHGLDDPVAYPRAVAEWPESIVRSYNYRVRDLEDYVITVACALEPQGYVGYEIVEVELQLAKVVERCSNAVRSFENTYWIDTYTGFVWASDQWLGPDLERATIEVVTPSGG